MPADHQSHFDFAPVRKMAEEYDPFATDDTMKIHPGSHAEATSADESFYKSNHIFFSPILHDRAAHAVAQYVLNTHHSPQLLASKLKALWLIQLGLHRTALESTQMSPEQICVMDIFAMISACDRADETAYSRKQVKNYETIRQCVGSGDLNEEGRMKFEELASFHAAAFTVLIETFPTKYLFSESAHVSGMMGLLSVANSDASSYVQRVLNGPDDFVHRGYLNKLVNMPSMSFDQLLLCSDRATHYSRTVTSRDEFARVSWATLTREGFIQLYKATSFVDASSSSEGSEVSV